MAWSQRRRAGGSPNSFGAMINAVLGEDPLVCITWNRGAQPMVGQHASFHFNPGNVAGVDISFDGPQTTCVEFASTPAAATSVTYSGTVPGFLSPQTIPIT